MAERVQRWRFDPVRFATQVDDSRSVRIALLAVFFGGWIILTVAGQALGMWPMHLIVVAGLTWVGTLIYSTRSARLVQHAAGLIVGGAPDDVVEPALRDAGARFTIHTGVRVLFYQHAAIHRHRQGRFDESAAISAALLNHPHVPLTAAQRRHLLLMLAEALLQRGDYGGAYAGLSQLHGEALPLMEYVQYVGLRIVYESRCGHDRAALDQLPKKIQVVDLLAPAAAATCHQHLGWSAARLGQQPLAAWLHERAGLLMPDSARAAAGAVVSPLGPTRAQFTPPAATQPPTAD